MYVRERLHVAGTRRRWVILRPQKPGNKQLCSKMPRRREKAGKGERQRERELKIMRRYNSRSDAREYGEENYSCSWSEGFAELGRSGVERCILT